MTVLDRPTPRHATAPPVVVDGGHLTIDQVAAVARRETAAVLSADPAVTARIQAARDLCCRLIERGVPIYGVTTGFGDSVRRQIDRSRAAELQAHLIRNLGCGTGPVLGDAAGRAITLIRANTLARGHSGVRVEVVTALLDLLEAGITPLIPEEGSVGASGDLVPLSYLAGAVTGTRPVRFGVETCDGTDALHRAGLQPLRLDAKEGLALVNGTAFMAGIAALATVDARRLAALADACTAMATEVLLGISTPFQPFLHDVAKPHPGQIRSAARTRGLLNGSSLAQPYQDVVDRAGTLTGRFRQLDVAIQDKYSLRCAPQFTGVLWDTLTWVERWVETEVNATTDNPLFDTEAGTVVSGGNFSGGHVALAMDALKTAVASVADLLDRQMELVVDEKFSNGLTPNLVPPREDDDPLRGLDHGFKGMQLACSSLTADALSRCMPLTAFSRSTECHNQDKVSMGSTAARTARDVVALTEKVAAIHLLALCQAADLRGVERLGATRELHDRVRAHVPPLGEDRPMDSDIAAVLHLLHTGQLDV
jgi:histidine ammonia-lyase/phenylalanine ammonia-lyase